MPELRSRTVTHGRNMAGARSLYRAAGVDGNDYDYLITRPVNVGTARIDGAEIGWNQFFDFLPAPFDGFGMSANYTYIDSVTHVPYAAGVDPIDTDGTTFGDLPADGLSKNSYNIAAFYEKNNWQVRLAYNWRSQFLLSIGPNGYNGGDGGIPWKLPVFSDSYGQLDGSIFYDFTDKFRVGLEATNLTNSYTRQIMEQHAGNFTRQVFMSGPRYTLLAQYSF